MEKHEAPLTRPRPWGAPAANPAAGLRRGPAFAIPEDTYIRLSPTARNFLACTIRYLESGHGGGQRHAAPDGYQ